MNKPTKLAFFGDAICTESRACPDVKTFVDIVLQHYGADAQLVHKGKGGGCTETELLGLIQSAPDMDMAFVFHSRNQDEEGWAEKALVIDNTLKTRNIPTVHFITRSQTNPGFTHGEVDATIANYVDLTRQYRVNQDYTVSDNGIDFVGNRMAAGIIIEYIQAAHATS